MKYIYLFPDSGAMGNYQSECRKFGCKFLGKNRFQGERNLVIRGELSDLKRYAEWLGYDLHPDYLYRENDFAGDIEDSYEDSKKVYRINAYKYHINENDWKECINFLKSKGVKYYVSDYLDIITEDVNIAKKAREILHINQMEIDTLKLRKEYEYELEDACKDDEIEGIYECKNNEVIEVRYDNKYKNYKFTFQKGGSPIILSKEEGKKLLRQYQAVKYQDSCKDAIVICPDMSLQEMKDYCEIYDVKVYSAGENGKYRIEGREAKRVIEELKADGFIQDYLKDACKDSIYINGTLKDFNPRELVEKVKQRQENLHTNRIDKSGKVHTIFIDAHGLVENPSLLYVDVITQDIKGDNQERVLMKRCKDWEEAIQVMENYKRQHMNDAYKDETPYQKQYNGLQKELKKMDSIHKAIKAYKKFKKDSKVNDYDPRLLEQLKQIALEGDKIKADVDKAYKSYNNVGNYYGWQKLKQEDPRKAELIIEVKEQQEKKVDELAKKWDAIIKVLNRDNEFKNFSELRGFGSSFLPTSEHYQEVVEKMKKLEEKHKPSVDSKCKDSQYFYVADPDNEKELIQKAKNLGCKIEQIGGLLQVIGSSEVLSKLLKISEKEFLSYVDKPMSSIRTY